MKNIVPLVISVILGLAAVFVVSKLLLRNNESIEDDMVEIVIAAKDLKAQSMIESGDLSSRSILRSEKPDDAILWENVNMVYGQRVQTNVVERDFLLYSDLRLIASLSDCCRNGEWTIPVTFSDPALVKMLLPEDEICILASFPSGKERKIPGVDESELTKTGMRETMVLLPCVKVVGFANGQGNFRSKDGAEGTIFISLPPKQAMLLIAVQREAELFPVLRRQNDPSMLNRREPGVVDSNTIKNLQKDLVPIELSDIPNVTR